MTKVLATFRIEEADWQAFKDWADSRGSNASSELVKYVLGCLGRIDAESIQTVDIDAHIDKRVDSRIDKRIDLAIAALRFELKPLLEAQEQLIALQEKLTA